MTNKIPEAEMHYLRDFIPEKFWDIAYQNWIDFKKEHFIETAVTRNKARAAFFMGFASALEEAKQYFEQNLNSTL